MYLGIEIGGTKLQLGLGHGDGHILALWRGTVNASEGSEGIREQIVRAVPELLAKANTARTLLRGAGIGFGGPTDDRSNTVIKSHQIAGWDGFPLADWVSDLVGVPAVLCNDADVAGLAEALFGAGKGLSPIFYITIGSGIGGGLIINGQIYRGVGRGAAEIGHLIVHRPIGARESVPETPLTQGVSLESVASGWGIGQTAQRMLQFGDFHDSEVLRLAGTLDRVTATEIGRAAQAGDSFACGVLLSAQTALAEAICQTIALLCPQRIVIGGGVSLIGDVLFAPLRWFVTQWTFPPFVGLTDIVPAALGEEVVVHGALALARQKFGG